MEITITVRQALDVLHDTSFAPNAGHPSGFFTWVKEQKDCSTSFSAMDMVAWIREYANELSLDKSHLVALQTAVRSIIIDSLKEEV